MRLSPCLNLRGPDQVLPPPSSLLPRTATTATATATATAIATSSLLLSFPFHPRPAATHRPFALFYRSSLDAFAAVAVTIAAAFPSISSRGRAAMASSRRTLFAANHDRPLKSQSSLGRRAASISPPFLPGLRWLLGCVAPRKSHWGRSFLRALLFSFLVGFFWGLFLFADVNDDDAASGLAPPGDFFFDPVRLPPFASSIAAKEEEEEEEEERPPDPFDKLLIIVTPTYKRAFQGYHLNRLAHTLKLVSPPLLWIVVETKMATAETADILRRSGVMYRHLVSRRNTSITAHRDVRQRHAAIKHIRLHRLDGIVYFADDDNVYSLDLFDRLRHIRKFGTWPVAMLASSKNKAILHGPVCNGSQVIGWHTKDRRNKLRRFHMDVSGFAFNSTVLWNRRSPMHPRDVLRLLDTVTQGFEDTGFIEHIVKEEDQMEGLPDHCSKIMNWRLQLEAKNLVYPRGWQILKNLDSTLPLKREI